MAKTKEVSEQVVFPDPPAEAGASAGQEQQATVVSLGESIAQQLRAAIEKSALAVGAARSQVQIAEAAHNRNLGIRDYALEIGNQDTESSEPYQRLLAAVDTSGNMLVAQRSQLEAVEAAHNKNLGMQLFADQLAAQGIGFAPLQK